MGLPAGEATIVLPDRDDVADAYMSELRRFVDREIYPMTAEIEAKISQKGEDPKLINKLGLLYARYGLPEKARLEFERVLSLNPDYLPTLANMGNLKYMAGELKEALAYYARASALGPDNPTVLLGIARVNHDLENYGTARAAYNNVKEEMVWEE